MRVLLLFGFHPQHEATSRLMSNGESYPADVEEDLDRRVRLAAFQWLRSQVDLHGEILPRSLLAEGFVFDGTRIPLVGPQGIFKPRLMKNPLSITTAPHGPYADSFGSRLLRYAYRGTDPDHPDNRGLRTAMTERLPLVYLYGLVPGRYVPVWPVFVVGDIPSEMLFNVAVDDPQLAGAADTHDSLGVAEDRAEIRREYVTALVRRRLHQQAFRVRVLEAYRTQCALCRLRHQELLDAAHITADASPEGEPVVSNGLSLCKLHHAAFDRHFLTVRSDYLIEVRKAVLTEEDGPMLLHGLKEMHLKRIVLPSSADQYPDPQRLEERYALFLASST
jgi:putative restriction endonuclease